MLMTNFLCLAIFLASHATHGSNIPSAFLFKLKQDTLKVKHTANFEINGEGSNANWSNSDWLELPKSTGSVSYHTKVKMLYSDSGIYCLYHCEDNKITATLKEDFLDLWNEDVVEAFFWTDE